MSRKSNTNVARSRKADSTRITLIYPHTLMTHFRRRQQVSTTTRTTYSLLPLTLCQIGWGSGVHFFVHRSLLVAADFGQKGAAWWAGRWPGDLGSKGPVESRQSST
ncbi:hypothetical protein BaRGS_00022939 [Batillaria attramentaria]|uniref:Uncharacterized protein n=1 Tax=Batillaria attramentaria TaxID=370345 RepID=A0ABD0KF98_9CAEN